MASKDEIASRRAFLKKIMVSNRDNPLTFKEVFELCNSDEFIDRFGYVSESRIRDDLKSLGIYPSKDNTYSIDFKYDISDIESSIVKALVFFDVYRPILIGSPAFDYEDDDIGISSDLYCIILKYNPSCTTSKSKYNIEYLLKKLHKYYQYTIDDSNFGCLEICTTKDSIKLLFLNEECLDSFYLDLISWKRRSNSSLIQRIAKK